MSVLVTGGAGFIGSHLVDSLLARGDEVVVIDSFDPFYPAALKEANLKAARDHDGFTLVGGDIRDRDVVHALPDHVDAVVHLAARAGVRASIADPELCVDVNLLGTSVLLGLARARGIRPFIFASSSSVYGETRDGSFREDAVADRPISPYAATKRAGELLCHADAHLHGLNCLALRFFTVYGPRQRPDLAIRRFARRLLEGEEIPRFGDGTSERDYTFVSDTVDGILAALERTCDGESRYEVLNLGRGEPVKLNRLIEVLSAALGVEARIRELPAQPGDVSRTLASIERAGSVLGYSPSVSFEEGIRQFAEWYLEMGAREDGVSAIA
ncbi:MAG: NAD-dependent epimerase/dehydratase family protein [Gemmatimonadota bacterium]